MKICIQIPTITLIIIKITQINNPNEVPATGDAVLSTSAPIEKGILIIARIIIISNVIPHVAST